MFQEMQQAMNDLSNDNELTKQRIKDNNEEGSRENKITS